MLFIWGIITTYITFLVLSIFRCQPGLVPKPDTITGCGPECVIDPDCPGDFVCENQKCIERPDPCFPSPCGPGATCSVGPNGNPICRFVEITKYIHSKNLFSSKP